MQASSVPQEMLHRRKGCGRGVCVWMIDWVDEGSGRTTAAWVGSLGDRTAAYPTATPPHAFLAPAFRFMPPQKLQKMRPVFRKGGTTTVGNACQVVHGREHLRRCMAA